MNIYLMFFFLVFNLKNCYSQFHDQELISKRIKLFLYHELNYNFRDKSEYINYIEREITIEKINQIGFDSYVFYKIPNQYFVLIEKDTFGYGYIAPSNSEIQYYIVALNLKSNRLFLINGKSSYDFIEIYYSLNEKYKIIDRRSINAKFIRKFISDFYIEGVDLEKVLLTIKNQ